MKYTYAYRSSDGTRHEAAIDAASRDAAFAALRRQGIKPIKVVAADGSKANGEVRGVRRRVVAAVVAVAVLAVLAAFWLGSRGSAASPRPAADGAASSPRHQIYGDPAIVAAIEHGHLDAVLPRPGDRYLAWFAQPGRILCPKGTPREALRRMPDAVAGDLTKTLADDLAVAADGPREWRELKQIVNGMRTELRAYLANGNGTVRSYGRRLVERAQQEAQIYERTKREFEKAADPAAREKLNDALRTLGLKTIPYGE